MSLPALPTLRRLDASQPHRFKIPTKLINEGSDLAVFLVSQGYQDIITFLGQLNRSMFPRKSADGPISFQPHQTGASTSPTITGLRDLLQELDRLISQAPPDQGPRRFGNVSFRKWCELVEGRSRSLLETHLPQEVVLFNHSDKVDAVDELRSYLLGAFGSAQRLDYGTGHELSFIAFLAGIWELGGFGSNTQQTVEREIVLDVIQPYLALVRKLILTYNLEPAGTHGVWGLDDHSFVPYIFGSAQYGPAIDESEITPTEGSLATAPDPGDVAKTNRVNELRDSNMYFSAIGFIHDVKKGPFWEHSPTLYDISGVKAGWGKINKGMMKMYNAEVLSKFPVVQHFYFGSLFKWDRSPNAVESMPDIHAQSHLQALNGSDAAHVPGPINVTSTLHGAQAGLTRAPWASGGPPSASGTGLGSASTRGFGPPRASIPASSSSRNAIPGHSAASLATKLPPVGEKPADDASLSPTVAPWAKCR